MRMMLVTKNVTNLDGKRFKKGRIWNKEIKGDSLVWMMGGDWGEWMHGLDAENADCAAHLYM